MAESQSNESPAPGRLRVRRQAARDFLEPKGGLERAAMKQGPVRFMPGSHPGVLGSASKPGGFRGRDVRRAAVNNLRSR